MHQESAATHDDAPDDTHTMRDPPLPEGMTLGQVLDASAQPPDPGDPKPVDDDPLRAFVMVEQLEWRMPQNGGVDTLGYEADAWVGYNLNRLWVKSEGAFAFDGGDEGEAEHDILYSRLITPYWWAQVGVQYAHEWEPDAYDDRWSGVVALQGTLPGMWETDASLYISDEADVTLEIELEYDLRITQRLVLQPRVEALFAVQDVPDRNIASGLVNTDLDLRLRYEFSRKFAPYVGVRYRFYAGETADLVESMGGEREEWIFLTGVRLAF